MALAMLMRRFELRMDPQAPPVSMTTVSALLYTQWHSTDSLRNTTKAHCIAQLALLLQLAAVHT